MILDGFYTYRLYAVRLPLDGAVVWTAFAVGTMAVTPSLSLHILEMHKIN